MLISIEGFTYGEAAEMLGVPEGTVTSRLKQAKRRYQELLDEFAAARRGNDLMQDLTTKLVAYVENKLDPETEMAIDDLIVRYVDDKLDADVATEIERVMAEHPAVADHIAERC